MKHKIKFLTIATIILNVVCCKPDCKEGGTAPANDLPKDDIGYLFPYGENQNLKFLKNEKDTIVFYNLGYKSGYNYTFTQEDCTRKVPLEFKSLMFYDSLEGNNFLLYHFINENFADRFTIAINKNTIYDGSVISFLILTPPYLSLKIGNNIYDTLIYKTNDSDYLYYKNSQYGLIKFKTNNNIFELIP